MRHSKESIEKETKTKLDKKTNVLASCGSDAVVISSLEAHEEEKQNRQETDQSSANQDGN